MAKFCTNCGKKLVDGKPCDCMKKQSKKVEEVEVVESNAGDMLNDFLEAFKGIFAKPVETMKKYANSSKIILVMIMIAVDSLVFGLYVYLFAKESIGLFSSSLLGIGRAASVPASVFFWPFLFMIVFFFALAGLLYLFCGPVLKDEADFKEIVGLVGVNALLTTVTILVALIFIFIKPVISIILLAIGGVMYLLNTYHGFTNLVGIDKNKMMYVFTASYAITLFIVCYILPKIFM